MGVAARRSDKMGVCPAQRILMVRRAATGNTLYFVLCTLYFFLLPGFAEAADPSFPRGTGFYFNLFKLLAYVLVYAAWLRLTSWVQEEVAARKLSPDVWNSTILAGGVVGLLWVWLVPWFWLGLPGLLLFAFGPALAFVQVRNKKVPDVEKVLTEVHLKSLLRRYLRINLASRVADEAGDLPPVRLIGRSFNQQTEDPERVTRAEGSRGYRAALKMIHEALQQRVTDIHLEPTKDEMTVRFRIDGIMQPADPFSRGMGDAVINIFKVLSNMDITEKRKPQDGSFSAESDDRKIDFRVATAGSVIGEKMVMRVLDQSIQIADLTQVGMRERLRHQVKQIVKQPHGMFIVCGPTGSGKSTTLYACLNEIDRFQQNVITIENPVEYQVSNVTQIEINPKAGKTFASELRSILRQDPDVIMVGEIRDAETAEIACQAAQTGHMVFTTLHANDSITSLGRLIDLGVQPFMISSALTAVLSQRLVRLLCPTCKVRYKPNPDVLRRANLPADKIKYFYRPPEPEEMEHDRQGEPVLCGTCGGSGYYGRTGVFELLVITDNLRALIRENPNLGAIKQEAVKEGLRSLQEDGLRVVIDGKTSIQELLRVSK
jgi:type II secretory ATPase GspE/PulE/Tfp pilus assembly ATPase PilB-like protein